MSIINEKWCMPHGSLHIERRPVPDNNGTWVCEAPFGNSASMEHWGMASKIILIAPNAINLLIEVKDVLQQLDNRLPHKKDCYNSGMEEICECTMCKINNILDYLK